MKRLTTIITAAVMASGMLADAQHVDGVTVNGFALERNGDYMVIDLGLDFSSLDVDGNRAVVFTPRLINGNDSTDLKSVGVYGRRRYYYYQRNGGNMLTGAGERSFRTSEKPDTVSFHALLPYREWMNGASLLLYRGEYGCCNTLIREQTDMIGRYYQFTFVPEWVFVHPNGNGEKTYSLSGSAFIDFPVDQTVIYPDYRRNTVELGKIEASIDSVRNDPDVTITQVWLKGYASPESPYSHNTDLAIGRTAALKKHIQQLYRFKDNVILTDYEPEDWAGLRRYVDNSNIDHRTEILALIDSDMNPDAKEAKIKRTYPAEYRFLLQNCYPALRHTDYRIDYTVRRYTDVEEIKRIMRTQPQKLSLNEFYLVAQTYEPGSDEFNEVFETAVRMYPHDAVANLNAANSAMQRGDTASAGRYLDKAGDMPEAIYARAMLAILAEDYETGAALMQQAEKAGIPQATDALQQLHQRELNLSAASSRTNH